MALKIKFPTLITSHLASHHLRTQQMIDDVTAKIDRYNNLAPTDKLRIPYRGKSKSKVIRAIHTSLYDIGQEHCIQICVEEYKEGYSDLYYQTGNNPQVDINPRDRLGSNRNYALLYPLIEHRTQNVNRWLVVIYDTPDKDDSDIVGTIKYTVNKILEFPFTFVIPSVLQGQPNVPRIEVSFATLENIDNEQYALSNLILQRSAKKNRKIVYQNVPTDQIVNILNDNQNQHWYEKKMVRIFHDLTNRSAYTTYMITEDENGQIHQVMTAKYSYSVDVDPDDVANLNEDRTMRDYFTTVINNYRNNGNVNQ